jgi:hypothetical protein
MILLCVLANRERNAEGADHGRQGQDQNEGDAQARARRISDRAAQDADTQERSAQALTSAGAILSRRLEEQYGRACRQRRPFPFAAGRGCTGRGKIEVA